HQDNIVLVGITRFDHQTRQLGGRFTRTASHIEDGTLVTAWLARRDKDNLQRQFSPRSSPAVLKYIVNAAAYLLIYTINMAGRQRNARRGGAGCRSFGAGERSP